MDTLFWLIEINIWNVLIHFEFVRRISIKISVVLFLLCRNSEFKNSRTYQTNLYKSVVGTRWNTYYVWLKLISHLEQQSCLVVSFIQTQLQEKHIFQMWKVCNFFSFDLSSYKGSETLKIPVYTLIPRHPQFR